MVGAADLAEMYRQQAPSAFRRALCLLRSEADAREVVQDVFVSLLERPEQYAGHGEMTAFMYKAITHACLNRLRNARNRTGTPRLGLSAACDRGGHRRWHLDRAPALRD